MSLVSKFDGYTDNHRVPAHLVLNLANAVRAFRLGVKALPIEQESFIEHHIYDAFCYMHDADNVTDYIEHYQWETQRDLSNRYPPQVVEYFSQLLGQLCTALHEELGRVGAWDTHGVLWFQFDRLLGDEIVLRRVNPQEDACCAPMGLRWHKS